MPKLIVVTREGEERELDGESGLSVMENLRDGGVDEILRLSCQVMFGPELDGLRVTVAAED